MENDKSAKAEAANRTIDQINQGLQNQCGRQRLRERVISRAIHTDNEARKAQQFTRLAELLDRHPDVAEIIELIEALGL